MKPSWNRIFLHYEGYPKLEKVKKKIYFFLTSFFCIYYSYLLYIDNYVNLLDYYLYIFSLFFNIVTLVLVIFCKTTRWAIIVSSFNDITNTSLAVWLTGGPYSLDIFWYFTLIVGLIVLVETKIGLIVAILAFLNIMAVFYAEYHKWFHFKEDAASISFHANMVNMLSVFAVLVIIVVFVTQKDLYEEEIIIAKDNNINDLETALQQRLNEINNIRTDIASDFHDVMGNKLASIANISQMLCIKSQQTNEFNLELNRINALSKELYEGTKDFIWSMDTANNTLHSVYFYIKDFGEKLFEYSGIQFIANTLPDDLENKTVSSLWSSQFILISKEILTNAMAHAKATEVYMSIHKTAEDRTLILFKDNGIGFDIHSPKRKNGLKNIQARASKINTIVTIYSEPDKGTTASIHIN